MFPAPTRAAITTGALLAALSCSKKSSDEAGAMASIKIGLIAPFSGAFADSGRQIEGGIKAYLKLHGDTVAGKKIEILVRDTTGPVPDVAKRLAQELVVHDKVAFLVGFGLTPEALAVAPVATEGKVPMIIMNAATSIIPTKSPYIVRVSLTVAQEAAPMGEWAAKNGIHKAATLVADYGPGIDAEAAFTRSFTAGGGAIVEAARVPLKNPEFSSFVQRIKDARPEAVFVFVPAGEQSIAVMKSLHERGLADAGIKIIATGDVVPEHVLQTIGDSALGVITTSHYSLAHDSPENAAFIKAYEDANGKDGGPPNFMSVGGYDGMAAIYEVVGKLGGTMDPDRAMAVLSHFAITSPRGPISIDPATRDIVQTIYVRRVERVNGELRNVEFAQFAAVKDPGK